MIMASEVIGSYLTASREHPCCIQPMLLLFTLRIISVIIMMYPMSSKQMPCYLQMLIMFRQYVKWTFHLCVSHYDISVHWCWHRLWHISLITLLWRHTARDGVSNDQPHDCLRNLFLGAHQRKHRRSASLAFVRGIHRWSVNPPRKWPVTRKILPCDDVIVIQCRLSIKQWLSGNG